MSLFLLWNIDHQVTLHFIYDKAGTAHEHIVKIMIVLFGTKTFQSYSFTLYCFRTCTYIYALVTLVQSTDEDCMHSWSDHKLPIKMSLSILRPFQYIRIEKESVHNNKTVPKVYTFLCQKWMSKQTKCPFSCELNYHKFLSLVSGSFQQRQSISLALHHVQLSL